jgi:hypothetical protein
MNEIRRFAGEDVMRSVTTIHWGEAIAEGSLSEWSVAHRSNSIDVPDFTRGAWKTNAPIDISMEKGGTTTVKL